MSSFLKTSFIHDETTQSESLVLLLKRSFKPTTSSPLLSRFLRSPSLCTHRLLCAWPPNGAPEADQVYCRQRAGGSMSGPVHAPGRFAKAGQAGLRPTVDLRAAWVDLPGFEQWQSRTFALDPNFEINFPFCWKCAICDFPSETSATPLPRFRMRYV